MARRAKGTGTIYKREKERNGKKSVYWEAQVTLGYDAGSGKQVRRTFTGATQKEVREKMQAAAVAVNEDDYFEPSKMTVAAWLDTWLVDYSADWKYNTKVKYKTVCETHIKPALGAVKLSKLKAPQIQGFYNGLEKTTRKKNKKTGKMEIVKTGEALSTKSVRLVHGVLSKALNTAVKIGYIKQNPAAICTTPKLHKKEIVPLTDTQIKALVAACDGEEYGRIYKLILFTGLRESEALGLTWDCIDFKTGALKINKQLQRQSGKDILVPLKNSKPRYLTAPPFIVDMLKEARIYQLEQRLKAGEFWQAWQTQEEMKTGLVFLKADGSCISAPALYQRYKHIAAEIGAPTSRVHDLRHTYAVLSLQNGDNVKTVQDNLGHATAAFTLDVYGHVSERMKTDSAERMQNYIEKAAL